jgi:hypothetical protein
MEPHEDVGKECTTIVRSDDLSDVLEFIWIFLLIELRILNATVLE